MNLPKSTTLKAAAQRNLRDADQKDKIVLIYAAVILGVSALVTIAQYILGQQIAHTGGLHSLGTRSILATAQNVLPIARALLQLCLDLGLMAAMLRIARRQYASIHSLRMGLDRFWPLARCVLLQGLILFGIATLSFYVALAIFMITPLSDGVMKIAVPLISDPGMLTPADLIADEALYASLVSALTPFFIVYGLILLGVSVPVMYRLRMARYVIIDKPAYGAVFALRASRQMMHGNCKKLFLVDLSFWWYYALLLAASALCYADWIAAALGIALPFSADVGYFLSYFLYLAALFAIYYFFRSFVETTYAAAYDAICPKERSEGVVLGNIFQM